MYEKLTEFLPELENLEYGKWIIDHENDGSPEHPKHMPFVGYSNIVTDFVDAVYEYVDKFPKLNLTKYQEILNAHDISWGMDSMMNADVSSLDDQTVMALIMGAIRADRFCEGALLGFFKDGSMKRWLLRLKEIEESGDVKKMENKLEIIGFYHEYDDFGCFSNWYPAEFDYGREHYVNSEQFMMAQKVLTFRQYELANQIMDTIDPAAQKKLGGTHFKEFNSEIWESISYRTVRRAVLAKFKQNPEIMEILLGTGNALLAECSANDTKWGIGIDINNPDYKDASKWRGKNYLGRILMEVREELRLEKKLAGTLSFHNAHHDEPIPEWNMAAGALKRIPQYYDAIHAYSDTLRQIPDYGKHVLEHFYKYPLCEIEDAMHTNMGGGLPVIGFYEMKQDVYDTARLLKLLRE